MKGKTCVHWRGTVEANCAAGVHVRDHVGGDTCGWCTRAPCFGGGGINERANGPIVPCDQYRPPSPEEIAEEEAWFEAATQRMLATLPLVKSIKERFAEGEGGQGADPCPVCETGQIHWSCSSYNHHVHARCTTDECVSFME